MTEVGERPQDAMIVRAAPLHICSGFVLHDGGSDLFRECDGSFDLEGLAGAGGGGARLAGGSGVRLAAADPEDEFAFGDDRGAGLGDDAEVTRVESELDFL